MQLGASGYSKADLDLNGEIQNTDITNILYVNLGKGQQFIPDTSIARMYLADTKIDTRNVHYSLLNAKNTSENGKNYFEVDVVIETTEEFKLGLGQLYFNYNTAAFGDNISANMNLEYTQPSGYILGEYYTYPAYTNFRQNDNTSSRISVSYQQSISEGTIIANNVMAEPKKLLHLKIEYINVSESAMLSFETNENYTNQTFTACGPSTFDPLNCSDYLGIQLFNDTFEGSQALNIDEELLDKSVSLFPNPVTDILTIISEIPLTKVEIYSVLGKKIKEIHTDFNAIATDQLSNSVYFLRIYSDNGYVVKKLIKK